MKRAALLLALLLLLGAGCSKKVEPPRRTEPWLANPSASAGAELKIGPLRFEVLAESGARFTLSGKRAKVSGTVPLLSGRLELDPNNLGSSRSSLEFDLARVDVAVDTEAPDYESAQSATASALDWLELGSGVVDARREVFRRALFELSAIEDFNGSLDLGATKATTVTAVGALTLHGFRAPVRARVQLQPLKTAPDAPRRLSIRSLQPVVLSLEAHDIVSRNVAGVSDATLTDRATRVIGKSVRVDFELIAQQLK
jgi:polyisoprenoid-binding protein YceI